MIGSCSSQRIQLRKELGQQVASAFFERMLDDSSPVFLNEPVTDRLTGSRPNIT
jgi:hypothetical protein